MSAKRSLDDGPYAYRFPSNYKPRDVVATREFPRNCGRIDDSDKDPSSIYRAETNAQKLSKLTYGDKSQLKWKVREVIVRRDFPKNCGRREVNSLCANDTNSDPIVGRSIPSYNDGKYIAGGKNFSNLNTLNISHKMNSGHVIEAIPLRSIKPVNLTARDNQNEPSNCKPESMDDIIEIQKRLSSYDHMASMEREKISILKGLLPSFKTEMKYENGKTVKSQEIEIIDLTDTDSCDSTPDQQIPQSYERENVKDGGGVNNLECGNIGAEISKSTRTTQEDDHISLDANSDKLINLRIVGHDHPEAMKVREARMLFDKIIKSRGPNAHLEALDQLVKENKHVIPEKPFGHIPGIDIGAKFYYRSELVLVGVHRERVYGIDYVVYDGKMFAKSIVNSFQNKNESIPGDVLIYLGQGGHSRSRGCRGIVSDQKLKKGNLALANSMEMGYPVRVTCLLKSLESTIYSTRWDKCEFVYDGLYKVCRYWTDTNENDKTVFKFELRRLPDQQRSHSREVCVSEDISGGKETMKIHVLTSLDGETPFPFSYMTKMVYPKAFEPIPVIGCNCTNGCSDSHPCSCVLNNGGKVPFNKKGAINLEKLIIHECGPQCKCPPTCMNRVSQHGPKHLLEIFKTKSTGWGVRSRNHISAESFICEYGGEFLRDNEAEERSNDEYLFDIFNDDEKKDGFTIDAAIHGNIGRFLNHSCSPNLKSVNVLYDHGDDRMPHIMFFAGEKIPPFQELTFDYNYNVNLVRDKDGNVKKKDCHCGSSECTGRMY